MKLDPDAPSRKDPKFREWHHWLVINVPGSDISKGDTIAQYIGSGPPEKTGKNKILKALYQTSNCGSLFNPHKSSASFLERKRAKKAWSFPFKWDTISFMGLIFEGRKLKSMAYFIWEDTMKKNENLIFKNSIIQQRKYDNYRNPRFF